MLLAGAKLEVGERKRRMEITTDDYRVQASG